MLVLRFPCARLNQLSGSHTENLWFSNSRRIAHVRNWRCVRQRSGISFLPISTRRCALRLPADPISPLRCTAAHNGGAASDDEVVAQLEAVAERLAREADAVRAAAEKKHVTEIQQALASAAMHEAKCREASEAEKEMSGRLAAAESHMSHLRTELSAKNDTLAWMERTVTGVKEEVAAREAEIRAVYAQKEAARELKVDALEEEHKALTKRLAVLSDDSDRIRQRKDAEMEQLEARVRQTVARKDESIAALREQLSSVHTTLAHTEQVRGSTSAELCAAFVGPRHECAVCTLDSQRIRGACRSCSVSKMS